MGLIAVCQDETTPVIHGRTGWRVYVCEDEPEGEKQGYEVARTPAEQPLRAGSAQRARRRSSAVAYMDGLVELSELAQRLGLTEATIKRKVRSGEINCIRLSRSRWEFTDQQITDYLDRRTTISPTLEPARAPAPTAGAPTGDVVRRTGMSPRARAALARRL